MTCEGSTLTCPHCGRPSRKRYVSVDFLNAARAELVEAESELARLRLRVEQLETEQRST